MQSPLAGSSSLKWFRKERGEKEKRKKRERKKTLSGIALEILLEGWSCVWDRMVFLLASLEFLAKGERKRNRQGEKEREGERVRERVREREGEKERG